MNLENSLFKSLIALQKVCLSQHIPFASYRLPLQTEITTMVQHLTMPEELNSLQHIDIQTGFVVAPFKETEKNGTYLLKPDFVFQSNRIEQKIIQSLAENVSFLSATQSVENEVADTLREDFVQQVEAAKQAIDQGQMYKVVLSKVRLEKLSADFEASTFFLDLCRLYPHAFVYLIQLPQVGCWIGATPEPLLEITGNHVKTVSLAGTQVATCVDVDSYSWNDKELEEQGIVTGYIENTLHSLHIENYTLKGPANFKAANLIHLKTSFEFTLSNLETGLGEILKALHPTPSVGGLPKDNARDFILNHEKHDRSYYTGFLGPVNIDGKSNVFVNLRCLQLFKKQFMLYSGAGITSASVGENEWEETDNKMMTMLNVMHRL